MTLTDFLLARIAEDEERADRIFDEWRGSGGVLDVRLCGPARMRVECEAKQRIVKAVQGWRHAVVEDCWYTCPAATEERDGGDCCNDGAGDECDCGLDFRVRQILAPLALPYSDHADYDEAWRPNN